MKFCCFLKGLGLDTGRAEFVLDSAGEAVTKPILHGKAQRPAPLSGKSGKELGGHILKLPS